MNNIPFELIIKIMSFLPVMDSNKKRLNRDIIEYYIKTKWIKNMNQLMNTV